MGLHPDAVVDLVLEELSFEGSCGISWTRLWELLSTRVPAVKKEIYQHMVYSWLKDNSKIIIISDSGGVVQHPETFDEAKSYKIRLDEEYHWIALTGSPKQNNAIGARAFDLLVAIAHSRSTGIDSVELVKSTGQDNRSLTSRIKSISHLIKKVSILRGGRTLSLFILNRFFDPTSSENTALVNKSKSKEITVNIKELREKITNSLKAAKNGIRQVNDLRREFEMDKNPRLKIVFKSTVTYLQERDYISKVLVVSPVTPSRKFRSLKYLKDYKVTDDIEDADMDDDEDEDDVDDDFNDELVDDQLKDIDDDEPNTSSLKSVTNLQVVAADDNTTPSPLLNRFHPTQNQLYELINSHGTTGCPTPFLSETMFGPTYQRLFARWTEKFTAGKFFPHLANYAIIRHYDFQGRVKFYRYLTRPNLLALTSQPFDPNGSKLPEYKPLNVTIDQMNQKHYTPFSARAVIVEDEGKPKIVWFGTLGELSPEILSLVKEQDPASSSQLNTLGSEPEVKPKRGRPRKGEERPKKEVKKAKRGRPKKEIKKEEEQDVPMPVEPVESEKLVISDLQGQSFKSIERFSALLRVLEDSDGVREDTHKFYLDVCEELGYNTDRKTFRKDVHSLIEQKKIRIEEVVIPAAQQSESDFEESDSTPAPAQPKTTSILISSNATDDVVEAFKKMLLSTSRLKDHQVKELDEVTGVDLDFFDQELRLSFTDPAEYRLAQDKKQVGSVRMKGLKSKATKLHTTGSSTNGVTKGGVKSTGRVSARKAADPNATAETIFGGTPPDRAEPKKRGPKKGWKKAKNVETADKAEEIDEMERIILPRRKKALLLKNHRAKIGGSATPDGADDGGRVTKVKRAGRKRRVAQLSSEETLMLFKVVIICKTVNENVMDWEQIAELFETATAEDLKAKWPRIRMLMGPNGISVARRAWKKILLNAVQEGTIDLKDIEELNLKSLLDLWQDYQLLGAVEDTSEKLYADVDENYKEYNFVKSKTSGGGMPQYDYNSMVQREQYLVNRVFTYDDTEEESPASEITKSDTIRRIIIAIVSSGQNLNIKKLTVLDDFSEDEVNEVFLDMTRKREIFVSPAPESKVTLGDRITTALEDSTYDFSLEKISKFQELLKDICANNKGLVMDPVFDNSFMVPILELIKDQALNMTRVDHYRKEILTGYEARTIDREKLDCDIILEKGVGEIKGRRERAVKVPTGKACSRIWIDVEGGVNKEIWTRVVRVAITNILSFPGITMQTLNVEMSTLLTWSELQEVVQWLVETGAVREGAENGLWLSPQWYSALGLF
ncbi:CYFA0S07e01376g1_1 [Cyberlindnera fabianii]|uniref:CYFA0S07e01376g1_1 n=1 Tax=Cyberlindnera fabianii TaxID=36022 RepID=A0A061B2Z2_CYBFA|nr:CYFA0S07e01376g1_1 [Cyberlindnera fabianii]